MDSNRSSRDDNRFAFSINLSVRNEWDNVDLLRSSVQNCFHAVFADVDGCHAVAMVTGELLENAIKYGEWKQGEPQQLRLHVTGDARQSVVTVASPATYDSPNINKLMQNLERLERHNDPAAAYREKLLAIADGDDEQGGLGLLRMAYEGNTTFEANVAEGMLTVRAYVTL